MNKEFIYQTPTLAGRPPFATDDDSAYSQQPTQATRRIRQPPPPDPNARTSAYNVYENYLDGANRDSGVGALGMGLMNGSMDDEDPFDDNKQPVRSQQIPLAAPRPGYAAPVAALNLARPNPVASPEGRQPPQMSHIGGVKPLTLVDNMNSPTSPRFSPPAPINVPSTPHPLQPPMTPIAPVFARPAKGSEQRDVQFASKPIIRSEKEETLLPKRGERGDDFWRRFSMVANEENRKPAAQKTSAWLQKTQSGTSRLSAWVWIVGLLLLACVAGGIGIGWYIAHKNQTHTAPTAIGGSAEEKVSGSSSAVMVTAAATSLHVSPTHTVARRVDAADAVPTISLPPVLNSSSDLASKGLQFPPVPPPRHRRNHVNRISL